MSQLGWILTVGLVCAGTEPNQPPPLRYLKQVREQFVLESEVTESRTPDGSTFVSRTERGTNQMTLTLRFAKDHLLTAAEVLWRDAKGKQAATLTVQGTTARLKRAGGVTDLLPKVDAGAIVTTAPDWSDILQLVRRYDPARGGRQEFPGLWIHPTQPHQVLTFAVERVGGDTVTVQDQPVQLDRYRVRLRSGDYLVWAASGSRVVKLLPAGRPAAAVVLEGYEAATRDLY